MFILASITHVKQGILHLILTFKWSDPKIFLNSFSAFFKAVRTFSISF